MRRTRHSNQYSVNALAPILEYLRQIGAIPQAQSWKPVSAVDVLLEEFGGYLAGQRSLTAPVVAAYQHWVRPFVAKVICRGGVNRAGELTGAEVADFLALRLPGLSRKSAQMTASALRSLLRFLHTQKLTPALLIGAVPPVPSRRLSGLPQGLSGEQVQALLDACDLSDPVGRRDVAVITLLCRLGLRCGEAAALGLDDIDWQAGTVRIAGKGGRIDQLPLPADVGEVLVDYLRHGRPETTSRAVFVRAVAPFTALARASLSCIVARTAKRAGLGGSTPIGFDTRQQPRR